MKHMLSLLSLSLLFSEALSAISLKGSPDRCKKENWSQIDTLLPARDANGVYPLPMDKNIQKIENVTPENILQSTVDHVLTFHDFCGQKYAGRGGYEDSIGTDLCERLAAYNFTHDGVLTNKEPTQLSLFSGEDLTFLRAVFKACRPSIARWWNYPLMVHVSFQPTSEELANLRKSIE